MTSGFSTFLETFIASLPCAVIESKNTATKNLEGHLPQLEAAKIKARSKVVEFGRLKAEVDALVAALYETGAEAMRE